MIELIPVELSEEYRKKFNETSTDFVHLYKDGKKISNTLYRVGGFGTQEEGDYFILIKHIEDKYSKEIMEMSKSSGSGLHLAAHFCILNKNGEEKFVASKFDSIYLKGGLLAAVKIKGSEFFINIETGETFEYGKTMTSKDYLFVDHSYHRDKSKRGILRINKNTGESKLYK